MGNVIQNKGFTGKTMVEIEETFKKLKCPTSRKGKKKKEVIKDYHLKL